MNETSKFIVRSDAAKCILKLLHDAPLSARQLSDLLQGVVSPSTIRHTLVDLRLAGVIHASGTYRHATQWRAKEHKHHGE